MQEGIVSVRSEEQEESTEKHVPLTARDLDLLNDALTESQVVSLREGSRFIVTAKSNGLQAGFANDDRDGSIEVYGLAPKALRSAEEAVARGWQVYWISGEPENYREFESLEFYTVPV